MNEPVKIVSKTSSNWIVRNLALLDPCSQSCLVFSVLGHFSEDEAPV